MYVTHTSGFLNSLAFTLRSHFCADSACRPPCFAFPTLVALDVQLMHRYQLALSYVDEELMMQLDGAHAEKATAARSALLLNAAACQLHAEDWHGAIAHCQEVQHVTASSCDFTQATLVTETSYLHLTSSSASSGSDWRAWT